MTLKQVQIENPVVARPKMRLSRREEAEIRYEELWKKNPEQFQLSRSARSRFCSTAAWNLIKNLDLKTACILGSGCGYFANLLHKKGVHVDAVDVAKSALNQYDFLPPEQKIQAYVPYTPLRDGHYDLVIAYDLVASLPESEHRLFFSELSRLAKNKGTILVSTNLDIYSEDALGRFLRFAQTEIAPETLQLSFHRQQIRLLNCFSWFPWLKSLLRQSDSLIKTIHQMGSQWQDRDQASHAILVGKKRTFSDLFK